MAYQHTELDQESRNIKIFAHMQTVDIRCFLSFWGVPTFDSELYARMRRRAEYTSAMVVHGKDMAENI